MGWGGGGRGRGEKAAEGGWEESQTTQPMFSAGSHCEQFWHGQGCPHFDVVHPAVQIEGYFPGKAAERCKSKVEIGAEPLYTSFAYRGGGSANTNIKRENPR